MIPRLARFVVLATVPAALLLVLPDSRNPYATVKLFVIATAGASLLALMAFDAVARRRLHIPRSAPTVAAAATLLLLLLATITSDAVWVSFYGAFGRSTGLLLYLGAAAIFFAIVRHFTANQLPALAAATAGSATALAVWALLDKVSGRDSAFGAGAPLASLGNPNFVAGALATALPLAVWGAVDTRLPVPARVTAGGGATLIGVAALATGSLQGPVAGVVGVGLLGLIWLLGQSGRRARVGGAVAGAAAVLVLAAGTLGVLGSGPLSGLAVQGNVQLRSFYWGAAVDMAAAEPVTGVGLDRYGDYYRQYQPPEFSQDRGIDQAADAAHNVPLGMFSSGGVPLGLAWLAFVLAVGWTIVQGTRRLEGERLLLLGGFAGAWAAYQLQALVSIDMPALALLHWVLAGAVVATVAGAQEAAPSRAPRRGARTSLLDSPGKLAVAGLGAALVLATVIVAGRPLRADLAERRAGQAVARGQAGPALEAIEQARRLAPWVPEYGLSAVTLLAQTNRLEDSARVAAETAESAPRDFPAVVTAARGAEQVGDADAAATWYERALRLAPHAPEIKVEAGRFLASVGREDRARELLREALELDGDNPDARQVLDELAG